MNPPPATEGDSIFVNIDCENILSKLFFLPTLNGLLIKLILYPIRSSIDTNISIVIILCGKKTYRRLSFR